MQTISKKKIKKSTCPLSLEELKKLGNSICMINIPQKTTTGFFLKIDEPFKFFVTNYQEISDLMKKEKKQLSLTFKENMENRKIELNPSERKIFIFQEEDVSFIQILEQDQIPEYLFFEMDLDFFSKGIRNYLHKAIFLFQQPDNSPIEIAQGVITDTDVNFNYQFTHDAYSKESPSGSPVMLGNKVIGVHFHGKETDKKSFGSFVGIICKKLNIKSYIYKNGDKYIGEFKWDKLYGLGCYYFANGNKYVGEFKNDKFDGQGTLYYRSGSKYIGQWKNDKKNGQGMYYFPDGERYEGDWINDKKEGQGTYFFTNGEKYIGEWKNDKKDGKGTYLYPDGEKFVGEWKNGYKEGKGTFFFSDGNNLTGDWKGGKKIEYFK